ncbi:MAG: hypothetical protein GTO55_07905, partial [Armatimonadetes bacterium]|nr:hypothetical protein [Armatimonadota bacterium]NIM24182.1 hypothetical protein [Armatimonadota bacterium]NIM68047.1 hypothetical protein [Armatimonadota bacterium]NIM76081.1 hypothetical protein [Armatimonadota bacterium]NIN05752.1 hypothetical protein [Armatimonadota bacterium]
MISKHLILLVLIALCIFALPVQFLSAAESAQTAPSQSDAEADTEKAKPTEVIIIGTMHGTHNKAKQYTVDELRKILLALKPAAICVEMFKGNIGDDGTLTEQALKDRNVPEVPVVDQAARTLGIRLFAIEWEERNDYWRETKYWEHHRRLNELFEQFLGESSKSNPQSLEVKIARLQEQVAEAQRLLGIHGSPEVI